MNKEAMKQQILEALSKKLGDDFRISIQKVFKPNLELDGLIIMAKDETINPAIYLEPFYEALTNGVSIDNVINKILRKYYYAKSGGDDFEIESLRNFSYVRDGLYVQLINRHFNQNLLQNVPHTLFLDDFAIIIRCRIESSLGSIGSFLVNDHIVSIWQVDYETILSLALQNTKRLFGVELIPMEELIRKVAPEALIEPADQNLMWIMTNKDRSFGATTVLFDDVLKDFAKEHGNFYVIFSSVNEVLLAPSPDSSEIDILTKYNQDINAEQLLEDEILGTKVYFYQKDRGFVL